MKSQKLLPYALMCYMATHRQQSYRAAIVQPSEEHKRYVSHKQLLVNDGWSKLATSEELVGVNGDGYFGVAYYHKTTGCVVIAHRGTQFTEQGNVIADAMILAGKEPRAILKRAWKYKSALYSKLKENSFNVTSVVHTGFSLGGFIAAALASRSANKEAVVFDSPGIGYLASIHATAKDRIKVVLTKPNVVNTANQHVGDVFRLTNFKKEHQQEDEVSFELHLVEN